MDEEKRVITDTDEAVGSDEGEVGAITFKLHHYAPPDLTIQFADNVIISAATGVIILSFLQTEVPLTTDREELKKMSEVKSKCVARIVMTPDKLAEFFTALRENPNFRPLLLGE